MVKLLKSSQQESSRRSTLIFEVKPISTDNLEFELDLKLKFKGKLLMDLRTARLLYLIDKFGKVLLATKYLNMGYSEALYLIRRAEKVLGRSLVIASKGGARGGSTSLTDWGKKILKYYLFLAQKHNIKIFESGTKIGLPALIIVGSDDPLMRKLIGMFNNLDCEYHVVGSLLGIMHIIIGDADIIVSHLYDPETNEYNVSFIRKIGFYDDVIVYRGYKRILVVATLREECRDPIKCLVGRKIAMRGKGSGTYHLLKVLLGKNIEQLKIIPTQTHEKAAELLREGAVDACITTLSIAHRYELKYVKLKDEYFDFIVPKQKNDKREVIMFLEHMKNSKNVIQNEFGYAVPRNFLAPLN